MDGRIKTNVPSQEDPYKATSVQGPLQFRPGRHKGIHTGSTNTGPGYEVCEWGQTAAGSRHSVVPNKDGDTAACPVNIRETLGASEGHRGRPTCSPAAVPRLQPQVLLSVREPQVVFWLYVHSSPALGSHASVHLSGLRKLSCIFS